MDVPENFNAIHEAALLNARKAEADFVVAHGHTAYCGFAWVHINEKASTKFGRVLKQLGFRSAYNGGLDLWNPGGSYTQSMDVKEAGADAYAETLRQHGVKAYACSRAD